MSSRKSSSSEWDPAKNRINEEKHGVAFYLAQYAFADPNRVLPEDLTQGSNDELRYHSGARPRS
ncbi:MAG: BrnT family toxin [Chloroflexota bacterium]|nr:BrnT family toxin [Chloroflexota bacterium]